MQICTSNCVLASCNILVRESTPLNSGVGPVANRMAMNHRAEKHCIPKWLKMSFWVLLDKNLSRMSNFFLHKASEQKVDLSKGIPGTPHPSHRTNLEPPSSLGGGDRGAFSDPRGGPAYRMENLGWLGKRSPAGTEPGVEWVPKKN